MIWLEGFQSYDLLQWISSGSVSIFLFIVVVWYCEGRLTVGRCCRLIWLWEDAPSFNIAQTPNVCWSESVSSSYFIINIINIYCLLLFLNISINLILMVISWGIMASCRIFDPNPRNRRLWLWPYLDKLICKYSWENNKKIKWISLRKN